MAKIRGSATHINSNTDLVVFSGRAKLHAVVVNSIGSSWNIKIYDNTSGTSNLIADITPTQTGTLEFGVHVNTGLRVVTTGTTPGSVTIIAEGY